jgi:hypothetical protein
LLNDASAKLPIIEEQRPSKEVLMPMLTARPAPRAVVMIAAAVAAVAAILAATDRADASSRKRSVSTRTAQPATQPAFRGMMPSAADPSNVEVLIKVLDTRPRQGTGYAQGNVMIHVEAASPRGPRRRAKYSGQSGPSQGSHSPAYRLKFFDHLGRN